MIMLYYCCMVVMNVGRCFSVKHALYLSVSPTFTTAQSSQVFLLHYRHDLHEIDSPVLNAYFFLCSFWKIYVVINWWLLHAEDSYNSWTYIHWYHTLSGCLNLWMKDRVVSLSNVHINAEELHAPKQYLILLKDLAGFKCSLSMCSSEDNISGQKIELTS